MILLSLVGCPYIFGGPDLSNVDKGKADTAETDTDTDTDSDTDTDTDTDTDSDTDTDNPDAPTIVSFEGSLIGAFVEVRFQLTDPQSDFVGGQIALTTSAGTETLDVPDDVKTWEPFGTSVVTLPVANPCDGYDDTLSMTITDFAGNTSNTAMMTLSYTGLGAQAESTVIAPIDLGTLTPPFVLCGDADADQEFDRYLFVPDTSGDYLFQMSWDTTGDYDIWIYDDMSNELAEGFTSDNPEVLPGVTLVANDNYEIRTQVFSPPLGQYVIVGELE